MSYLGGAAAARAGWPRVNGPLVRVTSVAPLLLVCEECGWTAGDHPLNLPSARLLQVIDHWFDDHFEPLTGRAAR